MESRPRLRRLGDDDESLDSDLLGEQQEWMSSEDHARPAARCVRVRRPVETTAAAATNDDRTPAPPELQKGSSTASQGERKSETLPNDLSRSTVLGERFELHLDDNAAEGEPIVDCVQEKYSGWFDLPSGKVPPFQWSGLVYSEDDGFPDILDLSEYIPNKDKPVPSRRSDAGKSIFATEFDRLNGRLEDSADPFEPSTSEVLEQAVDAIDAENKRALRNMTSDQIEEALQELHARINPELLEMLRKRGARSKESDVTTRRSERERALQPSTRPVSRWKQARTAANEDGSAPKTEEPKEPIDKTVGRLEVMSPPEDATSAQQQRYAMDGLQSGGLDVTVAKGLAVRQARQLVKLFDQLGDDPAMASIRELYLEQDDRGEWSFASIYNPSLVSGWPLAPLRTVFDAIQTRENREPTADDVLLCRLCLQFCTTLWSRRRSLLLAYVSATEALVRMSELFLIGGAVLEDADIRTAWNTLWYEFVEKQAISTNGVGLELCVSRPVAGLDSFGGLFHELLQAFEGAAAGDMRLARLLLVVAYSNQCPSGEAAMQTALWRTDRSFARVCSLYFQENPHDELVVFVRQAQQNDDDGRRSVTQSGRRRCGCRELRN